MNIKACLSHETDNWKTPTKIYNYFTKELGCIDCFEYKANYDEFTLDRGKKLKLFANPPFSKMKQIPKWVRHNVNDLNNIVYLLIPARTDTKYFHELLELTPLIYFIKGRLHYNDSKSAPFPTILLVFGFINLPEYMPLKLN